MKKIILSVLAVVLCAIGLMVFMIIRSFNVENYKTQIVQNLATLTGKKIEDIKINGESSLSWKPTPTFVMNNLTVANQAEGSESEMLKIDQVQVEMEWTSFFKSPLVIKRVILKKPEILVERKYTYQTNFAFPVLFQLNRQNTQEGGIKNLDLASIRIDELQVEEGTLRWKNLLTNNSFTLEHLNGTGRFDSLDGPYAFDGEGTFGKQKFLMNIQTGKMQISTPLRINIKLSDKSQKSWLDLSADLNQDSKDKWLFGGGRFSFEKPKEILSNFGIKNWYPQGSLSGSYKINVAPKKIDLRDVVLSQKTQDDQFFSCVFDWVADFNSKKIYLTVKNLTMQSLDFSLWKGILDSFSLKENKNTVEVKLNAVNPAFSGQLGDKLELSGVLKQGVMEGSLVISYPHDTSVSIKGNYDFIHSRLVADASFGSANILGVLKSIEELKNLSSENLKNVHLEGKLDVQPSLYQYDITKGTIEETSVEGKVGFAPDKKEWRANLKLKDLDLDKYYSVPPEFLGKLYSYLLGQNKELSFAVSDAYDLNLDVSKVRLLGTALDSLKIQGKITPDLVDMMDVSLNQTEENNVSFKGKISKYADSDVAFDQAQISGVFSDFELAQKWGIVFPEWLIKNHNTVGGSIQYTGNLTTGEIQSQLKADNAQISISGKIKHLFDKPTLDQAEVHLKYPNISHLVRLINPDKTLFEKMPVSVDFQAQITTDKKSIQWEKGILYLGDDRINTQGSLGFNPFKLRADIKATRLNADLFLDDLLKEIYSAEKGFLLEDKDFSLNLSLLADVLQYQGMQAQSLKSQFSMENGAFTLKEFSMRSAENPKSLFNLSAQGEMTQKLSVKGKLKVSEMPLPRSLFSIANYVLGSGFISTEFDFTTSGNSFENLQHALSFQGPFTLREAVLEGVDVSAWQEAVNSALKMAQMTSGFKSRLEFAFRNGKTTLPSLTGTVQAKDGTIKFSQIKGQNQIISLDDTTLEWVDIGNTVHIVFPFVLKSLQKSLPIILDITGQSSNLKMYDFIQSFQDNVKVEAQRISEIQRLEQKKEAEERRMHIQQNASDIFTKTDALVQSLQKKVLMDPSARANERMTVLNKMAQEVRKLAAKTNLSEAENTALLEKSKVLYAEAKDFENWLGMEDLMNQKDSASDIPQRSEKLMNKMEKIYQQNPRSVVMANLIVNARQVNQEIQNFVSRLKTTKDEKEVQDLLSLIKEDFFKLQKASDYMEKLNDSILGGK